MIVWLLIISLYSTWDDTSTSLSVCQNDANGDCQPRTYDTFKQCDDTGKAIEEFLDQEFLKVKWWCVETPGEGL